MSALETNSKTDEPTFLTKASLLKALEQVPDDAMIEVQSGVGSFHPVFAVRINRCGPSGEYVSFGLSDQVSITEKSDALS